MAKGRMADVVRQGQRFCQIHIQAWIAGCGRIGVHQFRCDLYASARAYLLNCGGEAEPERCRGARRRCRARLSSSHARGDTIDGAGKDLANAHGAYGVDDSRRFGRGLEGENQLCRGGERVFRAGMSLPPACPPSPSMTMRWLAGAAMCVTRPRSIPSCSRNGPCSMCNSMN